MKKSWIIVIIIVIVIIGGYVGRHKIKQLVMGSAPQAPTAIHVESSPTPTVISSDNIYKLGTDIKGESYITDFAGRALYTFDKDTEGVSSCEGQCTSIWPIYTSGATAQKTFPQNISVVKRADGAEQFAWKGMPLYYYAKDIKAGDILGDGFGGTWHLVRPTPKSS